METAKPLNQHIGRKISRIRDLRGIKQEAFATELGVSQQTVSRIEQSEEIEADVLEKIAKILGVTSNAIKDFSEEAVINIISSTLHDNAGSVNNNCTLTFNPIEKWLEVIEENKKLYERLLASEREKNEILKNK
jgi:transcriptional regulator with XRE-family HTH domain